LGLAYHAARIETVALDINAFDFRLTPAYDHAYMPAVLSGIFRPCELMTNTFFTIGHSTRTIVEFNGLLKESGVNFVVDVRSIPRSRTNPQFNQQSLPKTLAPWQIGYEHIAELGGLRGKVPGVVPSPNTYWQVRSFQNYADYALTAPFAAGLALLRERGGQHRSAIMCAEAVWWRCHRRIISDYLLAAGEQVMHILGKSHVDVASLTPGAVVRDDGTVVYPAEGRQPA